MSSLWPGWVSARVRRQAAGIHPRVPWSSPPSARGRPRPRGQSVVEFALVLPVFLLLLLIAVDFGRVFFTHVQLDNAVREAANYGATNPVDPVGMLARANAERNAQSQGGQQDVLTYPSNITTRCSTPAGVAIACDQSPGGAGAGNTLTVTLQAPFSFFTPFISGFFGGSLQISSSATVAVLNSAASTGGTNPSGCAAPTVATFTAFPNNLTVTLDPTGSAPDSGLCAISGYNYDFGDGNTGVGGTVPTDYTYAAPGTYTITLEVTNQGGALSTTRTVTVPPGGPGPSASSSPSSAPSATPCSAPVAQFSWSVTGNSGKVNFTDQSTTPTGCPITNWLWDFGDGTAKSNAQNPQHAYAVKNKQYTVTLTVTNSADSGSVNHTVNP